MGSIKNIVTSNSDGLSKNRNKAVPSLLYLKGSFVGGEKISKTEIELEMSYTSSQNSVFLTGWVCVLLHRTGQCVKRRTPRPQSEPVGAESVGGS